MRATLRARAGGLHIAQTEIGCSDAALVAPEKGASVVSRCMMKLGRDVATWLAGAETARERSSAPDVPNLAGPVGASGSAEESSETESPGGED